MWSKPRAGVALDGEVVDGIIRKLMSIDDKVDRLVRELLGEDGEEEENT